MPKNVKKKKVEEVKPVKKNYTKELYWVIGIMIAILIVFLAFVYFYRGGYSFNYKGLKFTKEKFGELTVYRYSYNSQDSQGNPFIYNLYLRNDPRKNTVPVAGKIEYPEGQTVYISVNTSGLVECPQSTLAVASLSGFLANNFLKVKGATPDPAQASESNITYATCSTHANNDVILIQSGTETSIKRQNMCYVITASNCQILDAVEKFEVQSILDAKNSSALK